MRTLLTERPFGALQHGRNWMQRGDWPARWIRCGQIAPRCAGFDALAGPLPSPPAPGLYPQVCAYRLRLQLEAAIRARVHVSADERYELFLNGARLGRGPERGDLHNWFFETYDLDLPAGPHTLVARVWALGPQGPYAQISCEPGFILAAEEPFTDLLSTGVAAWEALELGGYRFIDPSPAWGTGSNLEIDGAAFAWGFELGMADGWLPAQAGPFGCDPTRNERVPGHRLTPAVLGPMLEQTVQRGRIRSVSHDLAPAGPPLDVASGPAPAGTPDTRWVRLPNDPPDPADVRAWTDLLLEDRPLVLPPGSFRRVIVDLDEYVCAYPVVRTSGGAGAFIRLYWAESLFEPISDAQRPGRAAKGHRGVVDGRCFVGVGDVFRPDGGRGRTFETLWWQAGRYVEIVVQTGAQALTIERLGLRETRYPLEMQSSFGSSEGRLGALQPIMVRAMQMCAHETYMDCPYYEQLMYVGDTRLEALVTYCMTADTALPRKAVALFDASRWQAANGLTTSRYPSRVRQIIPPFSLWWVAMVHDLVYWRDGVAAARRHLRGVRSVVDTFLERVDDAGLLQAVEGWNFVDWAWPWTAQTGLTVDAGDGCGIPRGGDAGCSAPVSFQLVYTLDLAAGLEELVGEHERSARLRREAARVHAAAVAAFYDADRGALADDLGHSEFSEHAQALALLAGRLEPGLQARVADALLHDQSLRPTTIYFRHYSFEALRMLGRADCMLQRMDPWWELLALDLKTTVEAPEPGTRSDCHAWGAHPIYHFFTSLLGIRPSSPGFGSVHIAPQPGPLGWVRGTLVHPAGPVCVETEAGAAVVRLPEGLHGTFANGQGTVPIGPGESRHRLAPPSPGSTRAPRTLTLPPSG